jgi:hypothetical protein
VGDTHDCDLIIPGIATF